MKVYLAGPMRGIADFNFPAFRRLTKALRALGIEVTSPHEMDEAAGYYWEGFTGNEDLSAYNFDMVERLTEDIHVIGKSDAVVVMDGWVSSSGARAEASFAWAVGKPVYFFSEGDRSNGFEPYFVEMTKGQMSPGVVSPIKEIEEVVARHASASAQ